MARRSLLRVPPAYIQFQLHLASFEIRDFFSDFKIVCYYGGWSVYRQSPMAFGPENIDPFMCTHLIYSFTGLEGNKMVTLDNEADVVQGGYQKALDLKKVNPELKVISKSNSS